MALFKAPIFHNFAIGFVLGGVVALTIGGRFEGPVTFLGTML